MKTRKCRGGKKRGGAGVTKLHNNNYLIHRNAKYKYKKNKEDISKLIEHLNKVKSPDVSSIFPKLYNDLIPINLNWFTKGFMFRLENTKLTKACQIHNKINNLKVIYDKKWKKTLFQEIKGGETGTTGEKMKKYQKEKVGALKSMIANIKGWWRGVGVWDKKKDGGGTKRRVRRNRKRTIRRGGGNKQNLNELIWNHHFKGGGEGFLENTKTKLKNIQTGISDLAGLGKVTSTKYKLSNRSQIENDVNKYMINSGELSYATLICSIIKKYIQSEYDIARDLAKKEIKTKGLKINQWKDQQAMYDYNNRNDIKQLRKLCDLSEKGELHTIDKFTDTASSLKAKVSEWSPIKAVAMGGEAVEKEIKDLKQQAREAGVTESEINKLSRQRGVFMMTDAEEIAQLKEIIRLKRQNNPDNNLTRQTALAPGRRPGDVGTGAIETGGDTEEALEGGGLKDWVRNFTMGKDQEINRRLKLELFLIFKLLILKDTLIQDFLITIDPKSLKDLNDALDNTKDKIYGDIEEFLDESGRSFTKITNDLYDGVYPNTDEYGGRRGEGEQIGYDHLKYHQFQSGRVLGGLGGAKWYDYNCRNMDPYLYTDNSGKLESFDDERRTLLTEIKTKYLKLFIDKYPLLPWANNKTLELLRNKFKDFIKYPHTKEELGVAAATAFLDEYNVDDLSMVPDNTQIGGVLLETGTAAVGAAGAVAAPVLGAAVAALPSLAALKLGSATYDQLSEVLKWSNISENTYSFRNNHEHEELLHLRIQEKYINEYINRAFFNTEKPENIIKEKEMNTKERIKEMAISAAANTESFVKNIYPNSNPEVQSAGGFEFGKASDGSIIKEVITAWNSYNNIHTANIAEISNKIHAHNEFDYIITEEIKRLNEQYFGLICKYEASLIMIIESISENKSIQNDNRTTEAIKQRRIDNYSINLGNLPHPKLMKKAVYPSSDIDIIVNENKTNLIDVFKNYVGVLDGLVNVLDGFKNIYVKNAKKYKKYVKTLNDIIIGDPLNDDNLKDHREKLTNALRGINIKIYDWEDYLDYTLLHTPWDGSTDNIPIIRLKMDETPTYKDLVSIINNLILFLEKIKLDITDYHYDERFVNLMEYYSILTGEEDSPISHTGSEEKDKEFKKNIIKFNKIVTDKYNIIVKEYSGKNIYEFDSEEKTFIPQEVKNVGKVVGSIENEFGSAASTKIARGGYRKRKTKRKQRRRIRS